MWNLEENEIVFICVFLEFKEIVINRVKRFFISIMYVCFFINVNEYNVI